MINQGLICDSPIRDSCEVYFEIPDGVDYGFVDMVDLEIKRIGSSIHFLDAQGDSIKNDF